ncbi:MAG: type VI secretion system-associated protein TagF [Acetobacteraceae bacterium]
MGFWGKLPTRGDFLRAGLPASFLAPWDRWLSGVMAASREILGERWVPAWREAPIWRFALAPGLAGPEPAIGALMPSVDRVGRYFPLTLARVGGPAGSPAELLAAHGGWLDVAVAAGLAAVVEDLAPEALAERLAEPAAGDGLAPPAEALAAADPCLWWSEGGPRVAAGWRAGRRLPDGEGFAAMLSERVESAR